MKKMILAVAAMAFSMTSFAQRASSSSSSFFSTEKSDEGVTFGVRVGMNAANMISSEKWFDIDKSARIGFNVGVNVDIPVTQSLYVQTGLYYTQKGVKWKRSGTDYDYDYYYDDDYKYESKETWNPGYLELPILASYRYNVNDNVQLQLSTGPYLAIGVSGKCKNTYTEIYDGEKEEETEKISFFGKDEEGDRPFKRFDAGWQVGVGVTIKKFYIGYTFEAGFSNLAHSDWWDDNVSIKTRNHMINVGFNF